MTVQSDNNAPAPELLCSLERDLAAAIAVNNVPGAAIAVLHNGKLHEAAAGVLSCISNVEVTPDSLFHIGSVSKLFTATQIMQLVDRRKVEIDRPFQHYVPEFRLQRPERAREITVRQMLSHTSGIAGDFFEDTGPGDDCLQKYAKACSKLDVLYSPGERFSYCNTGYSLLGRLIEKATDETWEASLEKMVLEPLGMTHWAVRPEQELRFRTAVGHRLDYGSGALTPEALGCRSLGPGGSRLALTPRELLNFAKFHMDTSGELLSAPLRSDMTQQQIELPFSQCIAGWGLGWMLFDWSGKNVIGHDGGTAGMLTQLRVLPDEGIAVALMSNGQAGGKVFRQIVGPLLTALADVEIPQTLITDAELDLDLQKYVGTYRRYGMQFDVGLEGKYIMATVSSRDGEDNFAEPTRVKLVPASPEHFLAILPGGGAPMEVSFDKFSSDGRPEYVYALERAHGRIGDRAERDKLAPQ